MIDNDESNNETIIKNTKNNYIKTILLDSNKDPFENPEPEVHPNNNHPFEQHHTQQCVHQ